MPGLGQGLVPKTPCTEATCLFRVSAVGWFARYYADKRPALTGQTLLPVMTMGKEPIPRPAAPSACETAPEVSDRHHWQYRRPTAAYQLIITVSTRLVPSYNLLLSESHGPSPTLRRGTGRELLLYFVCRLCNSADLSCVTVLKTG